MSNQSSSVVQDLCEKLGIGRDLVEKILKRTFHNWSQVGSFKDDTNRLLEYAAELLVGGGPRAREFKRDFSQAHTQVMTAEKNGWMLGVREEVIPWAAYRAEVGASGGLERVSVVATVEKSKYSTDALAERFEDLKAFTATHPELAISLLEQGLPRYRGNIQPDMLNLLSTP